METRLERCFWICNKKKTNARKLFSWVSIMRCAKFAEKFNKCYLDYKKSYFTFLNNLEELECLLSVQF